MTTRAVPSDGDIAVALAGKLPKAGILLLQAHAAATRMKKRVTCRWLMARCGIGHSWFYELKRLLLLSGYLDESGAIYLPDLETTQRALIARAMLLRDAAIKRMRRRMQPRICTDWRTRMNQPSITMEAMIAKYGPSFAEIPDRLAGFTADS